MAAANIFYPSRVIIAICGLFIATAGFAKETAPREGPIPGWVRAARVNELPRPAGGTNAANEGAAFILLDDQVNVGTQESYFHMVKDFTTQAGVQKGSQLSFDFDPEYQELIIHHVRIWREGDAQDRLAMNRVKVVQRETQLDRHIYDGTQSALAFLDDVRVGDRLDYAFTIRGLNPILKNKFARSFWLEWGSPVTHTRLRVLTPVGRTLNMKCHGGIYEPAIRQDGTNRVYTWDLADQPGRAWEDLVPGWVESYAWIQLTEFTSWKQVNSWALELYPAPKSLPAALRGLAAGWKTKFPDFDSRVTAAVQFVQDEVRYLGFEAGTGSHCPRPPDEVFASRFGDCKDKTYLLCSLLKELGVEAWPILVHSQRRQGLANMLPSPMVFDHVITGIQTPSGIVVVDPTRANQRGSVTNRFLPAFALGLPIREDTTGLVELPGANAHLARTTVREFLTTTNRNSPASLRIHSTFNGADADYIRARFKDSTVQEIQQDYLNFYAREFPGVSVQASLRIEDLAATNQIEIAESYTITNLWVLADDESNYKLNLYAYGLSALLTRPDTAIRTKPLGLRNPNHQTLRREITLPEDWDVGPDRDAVENEAFTYVSTIDYRNRKIVLDYEYHTKTNWIPAARVPEYLKDVDRVENDLGYEVTWPNAKHAWKLRNQNWPILGMAFMYAGLLTAGAGYAFRNKLRALAPDVPPVIGHSGIAGWLTLVALGIVCNPFVFAWGIIDIYPLFSVPQWRQITSSDYHALHAPTLILELIGNLTFLVVSICLAVVFFQKRRIFPAFYIVFMLLNLGFLITDGVLASIINPDTKDLFKGPARAAIGCAIWIPYMLRSLRVKATFVR